VILKTKKLNFISRFLKGDKKYYIYFVLNCCFQQWMNFQNRLTFDEIIAKIRQHVFLRQCNITFIVTNLRLLDRDRWCLVYSNIVDDITYVYRNGGLFIGNVYGAGSGLIWLNNVQCNGTETNIEYCRHNGWGTRNCRHREDVSVSCFTRNGL